VRLAWSDVAKAELQALWQTSVARWGDHVALRYLEDIRAAAKRLGADPFRARPLKGAFRIQRVRSHYLIVHVDTAADRLTSARLLHVAMDVERHLP
jgi:plasmid stabilization system protein ParE